MALRLDFPAGLDHDETVASSNPTHGTRAAPPALTRQSPREPVPPACPRNRDAVIDRITPLLLTLAAGLVLVPFSVATDEPTKKPKSVHNFMVKDIDDKQVSLADYEGELLLIVNTASQCGYTPQYRGLGAIHEKYKGRGFKVLAFPANEFGNQEPGTNSEIKSFCATKYDVTFPLFSKVVVKGEGMDPLYRFLTSPEANPKFAGDITWNFAKFLVNRKGEVVARFGPGDEPQSEKVVKAIEAGLAEPR